MPRIKTTAVRLPQQLVVRIDQLRGMVPREVYVRYLIGEQVAKEEAAKNQK